jgi:Cysteine rich repeat
VTVLAMSAKGGRCSSVFCPQVSFASCLFVVPAKTQAGLEDIRTYCMSDIERLCKGIEPGGGRLIRCLKTHKKEMSVGCAQALQKLKAKKQ